MQLPWEGKATVSGQDGEKCRIGKDVRKEQEEVTSRRVLRTLCFIVK